MVSIIIPCLNEAGVICRLLESLQPLRCAGHEVILVDGGSTDGIVEVAEPLVDLLLDTEPSRSRQMNAGARSSVGDILWFLHADTRLPENAVEAVVEGLAEGDAVWGRFDIELSGKHPMLRVVGSMINRRSRWSGIATGDQGIFVTSKAFQTVGGFPYIPLMEDIVLSRQLKQLSLPRCLQQRLVTSSRRWEVNGIFRTILLMWFLRLAFFLGVSPHWLAQWYKAQVTK
ncbi:Glycosyl transferase, family 2 [hydrothermal vent metagenome]|uniref:Glycosyl transferase, family 2 n=1 Tax=hydrothermal vent metagenome TaxID=652676 RepID=A0A3B1BGD0_9ZZZZ